MGRLLWYRNGWIIDRVTADEICTSALVCLFIRLIYQSLFFNRSKFFQVGWLNIYNKNAIFKSVNHWLILILFWCEYTLVVFIYFFSIQVNICETSSPLDHICLRTPVLPFSNLSFSPPLPLSLLPSLSHTHTNPSYLWSSSISHLPFPRHNPRQWNHFFSLETI